ncbi:MAG: hypothetical protein ACWGSQ_12705 [Longimicrobiales bacterium]
MKLTVEENPETIKRYGHLRPAPRWGAERCSARCPGTSRNCTLEAGHRGHHVAHGLFRRVVAVWDSGGQAEKAHRKGKRPGAAVVKPGVRAGGAAVALRAFWGRIRRSPPSLEGVFLFVLAVSMVGFALDWALRILGLR